MLSQAPGHLAPYQHHPTCHKAKGRVRVALCCLAVQTPSASPAPLKASATYHSLRSLSVMKKKNKFYENLGANTVIGKAPSGLDFPFNCRNAISLSMLHLSLTLSTSGCCGSKTHHKSFAKLL